MTIPSKKYTAKTKLRAVKLALDDGLHPTEVTKKIGCGKSTLREWIRQYKEGQTEIKSKPINMTAEQIEIRKLKEIIELNNLDVVAKGVKKNYNFQLVLSGINIHTSELADSRFEAGCGDGLLCSYNQTVYIEFTRESSSYEDAVLTAINNIESCHLNIEVIYVDYDGYSDSAYVSDLTILSDISRHTLQCYKDYINGKKGIPKSIERIHEKHQLCGEDCVTATLAEQETIAVETTDKRVITKAFNEALEIKNSKPRLKKILSKLCDSTV